LTARSTLTSDDEDTAGVAVSVSAARGALGLVFGRSATPSLAVHVCGFALNIGVTAAQEQATRRAHAGADQA
jgi:hypothetical protein